MTNREVLHTQRNPIIRGPRQGRLHFIWELETGAPNLPDRWHKFLHLDEEGEVRVEVGGEPSEQAWRQDNFVSQVTYHRADPPRLDVIGSALVVSARTAPALFQTEQSSTGFPSWVVPLREVEQQAPTEAEDLSDRASIVAHAIVATQAQVNEEDTFEAHEAALELVRSTYRAYSRTTGSVTKLPHLQAARMATIVGFQRISADGSLETVWPASLVHTNPAILGTESPSTGEGVSSKLAIQEQAEFQARPTLRILEVRREAKVALADGDARSAIVLAAISCEMLISTLISSLLWEENTWPHEAAVVIDADRDLRQRLVKIAGPRLRGSWTAGSNAALGDWLRLVQRARNRIVHTGDLPSLGLATESIAAAERFEEMILDRLSTPTARKNFPATTVLIVRKEGLEARGLWTRALQETALEIERDRLEAIFSIWLDATATLRMPLDMRDQPGTPILKFASTLSGRNYWVEHDEVTDSARLVRPRTDVGELEEYARGRRDDPDDPRYTASFDLEIPVEPVSSWEPAYRLVPGVEVMRRKELWFRPIGLSEPPPRVSGEGRRQPQRLSRRSRR